MADFVDENEADLARLKEEQKAFKEEQKRAKAEAKAQKKEAKKKAKELADEEARISDDDGSNLPVIVTTIIIVFVWIAIICALIKLDVGGFGSGVLAPILKNVPVVNAILPDSVSRADREDDDPDIDTSEYSSLKEAVKEIHRLEAELADTQENSAAKDERISTLSEEVNRLQTFEDRQVEFERIKNEFYNEVVYAQNGPGADEYVKYYQSMDPATAESLYKQVIFEEQVSEEVKNYAQAYSEMKPKQAAAIFEDMTDDLELAAKILWQMEPDARGKILGAMDADIAARLTKIMEPDN
ncbi:MAG: hypothetical protein K6E68_08490 [Lachnospiraceae bacterium]|nr:hypothetical protein [Lachnospiraceae bacterium]